MKKKFALIAMLFVLAAALAACGAAGTDNSVGLDGTSWVLATYSKNSPLPGTEATLNFEGGQASGSASCNGFGGSYTQNGSSLSFSDLFMTEMYCMDPEGIMDQESAYLQLLGNADSFEILEDGTLVLFSTGHETLTFQPAN